MNARRWAYICTAPSVTDYPDVALNEWNTGKWGALTLYFLGNFQNNERNLVEIKKRWDPNNFFQHAQSIPDHKKQLTL